MLPSHDLATLIAVADEGSIHRAASVLGRTQPAVTQAIQRLEQSVGFALLDRSGYRVKLTQRGETFVKRARATVRLARDLRTYADVLSRGVESRVRIAVHGAVPIASWMQLFHDFPECFPETVLEIQTGEGAAPIRRLTNDECDLAIVLRSTANQYAVDIDCRQMGELEFVTVVQTARLVSSVEDDLASLPQILVADFDDPVTKYGVVEGHRYWRVSDHKIKAAAIVGGAGWGSVPACLVAPELRDGTLRAISYRGMRPSSQHPVLLCQMLEKPLGPAAKFIWEKLSTGA